VADEKVITSIPLYRCGERLNSMIEERRPAEVGKDSTNPWGAMQAHGPVKRFAMEE
jgi:hypothetical protein